MSIAFTAALFLVASSAQGQSRPNGTVLDAVIEVLKEKPGEAERLMSQYEFDPAGHSPHLSVPTLQGRRVGPYTLYAKPKGTPGPSVHRVVVVTERVLLDRKGLPTATAAAAHAVTERLKAVHVINLEPGDARLVGRWRAKPAEGFYTLVRWEIRADLSFRGTYVTKASEGVTDGHWEWRGGQLLYGSREQNTWGVGAVVFESDDSFKLIHASGNGSSDAWVFHRER